MGALLEKWSKANLECQLYDGQLLRIPETTVFKKIKTQEANAMKDEKAQPFRAQSKSIFLSIVNKPEEQKQAASSGSKEGLYNDMFGFIKDISTNFKQSTAAKALVRFGSKDFEITFSAHRSPVVEFTGEILIEGTIPDYIQKISNYAVNVDYTIVFIKSNQITFDINGSQYSIKFTNKKNLF